MLSFTKNKIPYNRVAFASTWAKVPQGPPDPILGMFIRFKIF